VVFKLVELIFLAHNLSEQEILSGISMALALSDFFLYFQLWQELLFEDLAGASFLIFLREVLGE
jgi:hypothetical protein